MRLLTALLALRQILYFISLRVFFRISTEESGSCNVLKEITHALAVRLSSYGCT